MGQDHSAGRRAQEAEAYGNVYVKLDQDTYLSDDTLTGTVYVMLRKPYPGDKLCLKVKGKEFTKWIDREQRSKQREDGTTEYYYVDVPREAEYTSVKHVVDIYDWQAGAVLPPGQFSFPISFKIPAGLASSFFLRSGTTVAEIAYYVEAYLKPERDIYPKIKHKKSLTIRQALKNQISTKEVSINQEVTSCCCCSKGKVSMWTAFEKNAYAPGEQARVVTEIDNTQCQVAVTNIRFELMQYIQLSAQGHGKHLNFGIVGENLGSVQPGEAFVKEKRKEACIQLPPGIEGSAKSFKGNGQVQEYSLSPQQAISPSTNGVLVKSNFGLRVSCGMDGCCLCTAAPATELPVTIYSIIQKKSVDPTPPPGWNPTPMPAANVTIVINVGGPIVSVNAGMPQQQGNPFGNPMPAQQNTFQPQIQQQPQMVQQQPPMMQQQQPPMMQQQQPQMMQQQQPQMMQQQPQMMQQQQQQPQYQQPQPQMQQSQGQYGQPQMNQGQYGQPQMQQSQGQYGQPGMNQGQYQGQPQMNQGQPQMNTQGYANNYGNPNQYGNGM